MGILAELSKAGLLNVNVNRVDGFTLGEALAKYDITSANLSPEVEAIYKVHRLIALI